MDKSGVVGSFTGGQATHARLANACATNWFAAGNTIYVGDNHVESQTTAITLAPVSSATTIGKIFVTTIPAVIRRRRPTWRPWRRCR